MGLPGLPHLVLAALTFLMLTGTRQVRGLECYVCHDQDGNTEKCLQTIATCEQEHDRCLSIIRWSTTPYWSQGAEKQYYVSKKCATADQCDREVFANMPLCHYIWYEDWKCAECCQGDRCNYYVTLGASSMSANFTVLFLALWLTCSWAPASLLRIIHR